MKQRTIMTVFAMALLMAAMAVPAAEASLIDIGTATYGGNSYNLIYDNNPSGPVVWLDFNTEANTWSSSVAWASSLNNTGVITYNFKPGYNMNWSGGWQLPSTVDNSLSYATYGSTPPATSSQWAYLFYTQLGNKAGYPNPLNIGPFTYNFNDGEYYWSGTQVSSSPGWAWCFDTSYGAQVYDVEANSILAIANRPGQLVVTATPLPATLLLFGPGLASLAVLRRRLRK